MSQVGPKTAMDPILSINLDFISPPNDWELVEGPRLVPSSHEFASSCVEINYMNFIFPFYASSEPIASFNGRQKVFTLKLRTDKL